MITLNEIISILPDVKKLHPRGSVIYNLLNHAAIKAVETLFDKTNQNEVKIQLFKDIIFPYIKMGVVDSKSLFGLDELILFSFYWKNQDKYNKVFDIGANIGLHTLLLAKLGYIVTAFEPDPFHYKQLCNVLALNGISNVKTIEGAVSNKNGKAQFVRVLGNTTSSHLKGCKTPYGELETFEISIFNIKDLFQDVDLIKMDVEGHEADILCATTSANWEQTDALIEVGSSENASCIFKHLQDIHVNAFAQKLGWKKIKTINDMPKSYKEGSLFLSKKAIMPW